MISLTEALNTVLSQARPLPVERVDLAASLGRVLAQAVASDMDCPPFDKACMDGFAARRQDLDGPLTVLETVAAGKVPRTHPGPGQCVRIMTGAMIPPETDVVFMVEHSENLPDGRVRFTGHQTPDNIARQGEDFRCGETVLEAGALLAPQHLAVLASVGVTRPLVSVPPRVGILATGAELVEPNLQPGLGQIRNSNSTQLAAQVRRLGCPATDLGAVDDERDSLAAAVNRGLAGSDVLVLSGGVSMGDFDLVPDVLVSQGVVLFFDSIAVKPGKPTTFGMAGDKAVFALPGNPVSSFVSFELLVRPFLLARQGHRWRPPTVIAPLAEAVTRRRSGREEWRPVRLDDQGRVWPLTFHGSGHFAVLTRAEGLLRIPAEEIRLETGFPASVRLI